jgi:hypothetical protein
MGKRRSTHQRAAPNVNVLSVQGVLQQPNNVVANGVSGRETLGPGQDLAGCESGLLDGEAAMQAGEQGTN